MAKAINEGLRTAMVANNKVMVMGEDIAQLGGVFRVTEGLQEQFGPNRIVDTPLAESGIVGTAIGLAMRGYRPVCEIQFDGFCLPRVRSNCHPIGKANGAPRGNPIFSCGDSHPLRRAHRSGGTPPREP